MAQPKWLTIALAEVGVHETRGAASTARITEYYAAAGSPRIKDDVTAWCSAFMCFVIEKAGLPSTNNLAARSWLKWGKSTKPVPGAIGIKSRGKSTWQGHVTMVVKVEGDRVQCVGGNQADSVNLQWFRLKDFIDFRWPNTAANSVSLYAASASGSGTFLSGLSSVIDQAQVVTDQYSQYIEWLQYVGLALAAAGLGVMAYRHFGRLYKWARKQ